MSRGNNEAYGGAGKRRATKAPSWWRRHKIITFGLVVVVCLGLASAGYVYNLNNKFKNIDHIGVTLKDEDRPDPSPGQALNILILGADAKDENNHNNSSIAQDVAKAKWPVGSHRSDTIMVMHISADRKHVYLFSVPRDSYVPIYDAQGQEKSEDKINAAFSYYGPSGAISTVEHLTNLRMDHLAIMDWNGFKDLSSAVGGVRIYIPETFYDDSQKVTWKKGWNNLEGTKALQYVRTRHGLANGDFDRIARQQNFIRALMKKVLDQGTLSNPLKLNSVLDAVTNNLTVDQDFTNGDVRGLALALRGVKAEQVVFLTAPTSGFGTADNGASILNLDTIKLTELVKAIKKDQVDTYIAANPDAKLKDSAKVH